MGRGGALAASLVAFSAVGCGGQETAPEVDPVGQPTEEPPSEPPPADDPDRYEEVDESVAVDAYGVAPDEGDDGRVESDPEPEASPEPVPMPAYGIAPPIRDDD